MKKLIFFLPAVLALLAGCNKDFLDRQPLSQLSPSNAFNSESELQLYVNSFYDMLPIATDIYGEKADNIVTTTLSNTQLGTATVPVSGGDWSWGSLRNINFFLQNYSKGHLADNVTAPYVGAARFFRAYFYSRMVATFGDVPWYSTAIDANDSTMLLKPRDSRMVVVDSILSDLDYAIAHLPATPSVEKITKWTALALKSRVCLYEGTWREYHANDIFGKDSYGKPLTGYKDLLQQCVNASDSLMQSGMYSIYTSSSGHPYQDLFDAQTPIASEMILVRSFSSAEQVYHNLNYYTVSPSFGKPGLEKALVNSYLMKDGTRFTDIPGYQTMGFYQEIQNRDPRLGQTVRAPGYTRIGSSTQLPPDFGATVTGYQLIKFVSDPSQDINNRSVTPMPIFRYAEVLLNFAEAKAELGTLQQSDVDRSIKLLRDRVGMPDLDEAAANANPDPVLGSAYPNVTGALKGVILEIRRERRIELVMEGFRWDDLMRWAAGQYQARQYYGMYFPGPGTYDLDGNGKPDVDIYTGSRPPTQQGVVYLKLGSDITLASGTSGEVIVNGDLSKKFTDDRDYLSPLPTQELLLNSNLTQNPHW